MAQPRRKWWRARRTGERPPLGGPSGSVPRMRFLRAVSNRLWHMAKLKVERLQPGMVVGLDVKNMDGMLLMPAGCELSERHILVLKTWGIPEVTVQNVEGGSGAAATPDVTHAAVSPAAVRALKARFWAFEADNPVHQEILRCLLSRKAKGARPC